MIRPRVRGSADGPDPRAAPPSQPAGRIPPDRPRLPGGIARRPAHFRKWILRLWGWALLATVATAADIRPNMLLLDGAKSRTAVVVVGERGTILLSNDHARTWRAATTPTRATLTAISFAPNSSLGWAVGHDAVILGTTDGGMTWVTQFQGENPQDSFLDVLAIDSGRVIAVGAYGLVYVSADGGQTWQRQPVPAGDYHLNRISRGPYGTLYLAGESGTLLRSTDHGATWLPITAPYAGSFYGILPLDRSVLLAHGLRGHVFRSTDDGESWEQVATPQPVLLATALLRRNGSIVFAGQARTLLVSADGGKSVSPSNQARSTAVAELVELGNGTLLTLGEDGASVLELPNTSPKSSLP